MRKPSVLFLNRVYPPGRGATGRLLRDLTRAFAQEGWDVTVITTGPLERRERDGSVRIMRLKAPEQSRSLWASLLVWIRMLMAGLSVPRHDLVVTMTDPPLFIIAGRIISRARKCAHMHWCQDLYPDVLPALGVHLPETVMKFLKVMSRRAMKKCDKVVVPGRCMARYLTHNGMDPRRVSVIPNWPDAELAGGKAGRSRRRLLRTRTAEGFSAQSGIPARPYEKLFRDAEPKFRVLYAGNLGRAHPVDTVVGAAEILARSNPEIEFVFVGEGPRFDRLVHARARRGLENIRFLPWQPASRLKELMETGDIHLISMAESAAGLMVPSKLYAALAVGRPTVFVGPMNCETARTIRDFNAGSVVAQGDPLRLAETIRQYRLNSDMWFVAQEGASKAGQIFTPDQAIAAWVERARSVVNIPVLPLRRRSAA